MRNIHMTLCLIGLCLGVSAQSMVKIDSLQSSITDTIYSCSSHPDVKSGNAGNCPKCSKKLEFGHNHVQKSKEGYVCTMHPDKKSKTPGKCPTCGMKLIETREPEQNKGGLMGGEN